MKITQDFIPIGCNNRRGVKLSGIKGLVIHWIGVAQPKASVIKNNYEKPDARIGASQYIIDYNTGEIIQTMPEDEMTYHVGANSYTRLKEIKLGNGNPNYKLVGIECCINKNDVITNDYANKNTNKDLGKPSEIQYKNLVEFSADFLLRHNLTIGDLYRHYDITGKACHVYFCKNEDKWQQFKQNVLEEMEVMSMPRYTNLAQVPAWGQATIQKLIKKGYLAGVGNSLDLSLDMIRIFVINDKAGLYDIKEG